MAGSTKKPKDKPKKKGEKKALPAFMLKGKDAKPPAKSSGKKKPRNKGRV